MSDSEKPKSLLGYMFTLIGGAAIAAVITGYFNLQLETRKFESSVIQSVIAQDTKEKRIELLEFLLDLKLIRDTETVAGLRDAITKKNVPQQTQPAIAPVIVQASESPALKWAVLFGGYKTLDEAKQEQQKTIATGMPGPTIYKNGPLFELAIPAPSRPEASTLMDSLLSNKLSKTPLVIELPRWCPNPTPREGYMEGNPAENQYLQSDKPR
jgi:hypothetical protein